MLIYVSVMLAFRGVIGGRNIPDRTVLLERLAPAPGAVVDGLLSRFTETPRGSTKCVLLLPPHFPSSCEFVERR